MRDFLEEEKYYYSLPQKERDAYNEQVIKDWNLDDEESDFQRHFDEYVSFEDMKKLDEMHKAAVENSSEKERMIPV